MRVLKYTLVLFAISAGCWFYWAYGQSVKIGNAIESARKDSYIETDLRSYSWLRDRLQLSFIYPFDRISSISEYKRTGDSAATLQPLIDSHMEVEFLRLFCSRPYDDDINHLCSGLQPKHLTIVVDDDVSPSPDTFIIEQNDSLRSLTVTGWRVGNEVWQLADGALNLEELDITACHDVTTIPQAVGFLNELRVFKVRNCMIEDQYFINLANCPKLESIDCSATLIGDEGLKSVCLHESLKILIVSSTDISQKGFENVRFVENLAVLDVSHTSIDSLAPLKKCKNLISLDASGLQIDSDQVDLIVSLPELRCLTITLHEFGIGMVKPLVMACPKLETINIEGLFIEKATIDEYRVKRPGVRIDIGPDPCPCYMCFVKS